MSRDAVQHRSLYVQDDAVIQSQAKPRTCLRCDRTFASWGAANRLCAKCQESLRAASYESMRGKVKGLGTWREDG
jgi:hypothetical protein